MTPERAGITAAQARELFSYDHETGAITWRIHPGGKSRGVGARAGNISGNGYRLIRYRGIAFWEHRLAWLLFHGRFPAGHIDHVNHNPQDNRITNLRDASAVANWNNRSVHAAPYWRASRATWTAAFQYNKKTYWIGDFKSVTIARSVLRAMRYFISTRTDVIADVEIRDMVKSLRAAKQKKGRGA